VRDINGDVDGYGLRAEFKIVSVPGKLWARTVGYGEFTAQNIDDSEREPDDVDGRSRSGATYGQSPSYQ
jgi:hypothetical protein